MAGRLRELGPLALVCALAVGGSGAEGLVSKPALPALAAYFWSINPIPREIAQPSAPPPSLAELPQEPVLAHRSLCSRVGATTNEGAAGQAGNDAC